MIRYTDDHGLRQYRPSLCDTTPIGWLQRLVNWWHKWRAGE